MPAQFSAPPRPEFTPNWNQILLRDTLPPPQPISSVSRRRILVTGAGGFIGSRMVRLLAASGADRIILLEIAEQALFSISAAMASLGHGDRIAPIPGSVYDRPLLEALFHQHRPELVIHAAALKHVPLMERNPFAAIATNSIGTWLLAEIASRHRARTILISTDKAVAPHSIMGASKRIAELAVLAHPGFAALRLVNVIGSPGSVGPIFAEQIRQGGPVTVTHPAAQRYFLTLDEVAGLLAEAIERDSAAGILVPDPGEPILIADLARRMIAASRSDAPIVFTAPRPGEKLEESLLASSEHYSAAATPSLRHVISPAAADLDSAVRALASAVAARDLLRVLTQVKELVPGYQPSALLRDAALELSPAIS